MEEAPAIGELHDDDCGQIFQTTHCRTPDGRYMVQLPLRRDAPELGDSYAYAARHFYGLERRMIADPTLREKYVNFMWEYAEIGHMEPVETAHNHSGCYCITTIPHHAVSVKFRVVFNASAPTTTGVSLNDIQLVGPTLHDPLINVLLRFRRYRVT
ncbi:PREDICTED: uncharacterized protein LOC108357706, partial [Rhagoletis zephyria]|uniref:uncharacterized protein LOC108357706 n=1 Tax=Rhagoletis zephyria TaxID=28612 RepID=UPI000811867F